jgi:murein DD-endopeptidase MepM/ murein hydrolase activator NlpD
MYNDCGNVISSFGEKEGRDAPHNGTDFRNRMGGNVYSSHNGVVTRIFFNRLGGNQIIILNFNLSVSGYAHTAATINWGDVVAAGEQIGNSDGSGRLKGPHLHYTYRPCPTCEHSDPEAILPKPPGECD